jgi:hypothetical protein
MKISKAMAKRSSLAHKTSLKKLAPAEIKAQRLVWPLAIHLFALTRIFSLRHHPLRNLSAEEHLVLACIFAAVDHQSPGAHISVVFAC